MTYVGQGEKRELKFCFFFDPFEDTTISIDISLSKVKQSHRALHRSTQYTVDNQYFKVAFHPRRPVQKTS